MLLNNQTGFDEEKHEHQQGKTYKKCIMLYPMPFKLDFSFDIRLL